MILLLASVGGTVGAVALYLWWSETQFRRLELILEMCLEDISEIRREIYLLKVKSYGDTNE